MYKLNAFSLMFIALMAASFVVPSSSNAFKSNVEYLGLYQQIFYGREASSGYNWFVWYLGFPDEKINTRKKIEVFFGKENLLSHVPLKNYYIGPSDAPDEEKKLFLHCLDGRTLIIDLVKLKRGSSAEVVIPHTHQKYKIIGSSKHALIDDRKKLYKVDFQHRLDREFVEKVKKINSLLTVDNSSSDAEGESKFDTVNLEQSKFFQKFLRQIIGNYKKALFPGEPREDDEQKVNQLAHLLKQYGMQIPGALAKQGINVADLENVLDLLLEYKALMASLLGQALYLKIEKEITNPKKMTIPSDLPYRMEWISGRLYQLGATISKMQVELSIVLVKYIEQFFQVNKNLGELNSDKVQVKQKSLIVISTVSALLVATLGFITQQQNSLQTGVLYGLGAYLGSILTSKFITERLRDGYRPYQYNKIKKYSFNIRSLVDGYFRMFVALSNYTVDSDFFAQLNRSTVDALFPQSQNVSSDLMLMIPNLEKFIFSITGKSWLDLYLEQSDTKNTTLSELIGSQDTCSIFL